MSGRGVSYRRRLRAGAGLATGLLATVAVGVGFAGLYRLAGELGARFDVTATRAHEPSPRMLDLLETLPGETEIVVVGALEQPGIDGASAQRVRDTFDELDRRSDLLGTRWIDPRNADGAVEARDLLAGLVERDAGALKLAEAALTGAIEAGGLALAETRGLAVSEELGRRVAPAAGEIERRLATATALVQRQVLGLSVPAVAEARATLDEVAAAFGRIGDAVAAEGGDSGGLSERAGAMRDALATLSEGEPGAATAAGVLSSEQAVVVSGPTGVRAIPLGLVFPPPPADPSVGVSADAGPRAEALIAQALGQLRGDARPLVVFTHGEAGNVLRDADVLDAFAARVRRGGYELVEWAPVLDPEPPAVIETASGRPVVFVVIGTDAAADGAGPGRRGPERATAVARAIETIGKRGDPAMICLAPSPLPAYGTPDPVATALASLGVSAGTEQPLLTTEVDGRGRVVTPDHTTVSGIGGGGDRGGSDHPVASAVSGLGVFLPWPVEVTAQDDSAESVELLTLGSADDERVWAETTWQSFRTVAEDRRALVANPPKPDAERGETGGPWSVGVALERRADDGPQRLVVVGSNRWLFDEFVERSAFADGRLTLVHPGNAELIEASLAWLSGREAPRGASALVPRIRGLSGGALTGLRIGVAVGMPVLVLCVGGVLVVLRRL